MRPGPHGRRRRIARPAAALLASVLAACGGAAGRGGPAPASRACVVVPPQGDSAAVDADPARPVVVGVAGPVDPSHAPVPRTWAERIVFAQLYRPLVGLACDGRVVPGIAVSWSAEREGRLWTFTIDPDARDWAGAPVTAAAVAAGWRDAGRVPAADRAPGAAMAPRTDIVALDVVDARTLRVELTAPAPPSFFARPDLAVRSPVRAAGWPVGSGPYRPRAERATPDGPVRRLSLVPRGAGPPVEVRTVAGDARNALDGGVDLLVTAEPAVIDYAAAAADLVTVPLPWDRSYVLVAAATGAPPDAGRPRRRLRVVRPPGAALEALARDAVRVAARPAGGAPAAASDDPALCDDGAGARAPAGDGVDRRPASGRGARAPAVRGRTGRPAHARRARDRRIVYPAGDGVARSLAERLVALALDPGRVDADWLAGAAPGLVRGGGRVVAAGLPAPAFDAALREGRAAAYVLPIERGPAAGPCAIVDALRGRVPWLAAAERRGPNPAPGRDAPHEDGAVAAVVPLVDTRATLIVRRGIGGVAVDGRGTILLDGLRRFVPSTAARSGTRP